MTLHDEDHLTVADDGAGSRLGLLPGETPGDDRPVPATWDGSPDQPDDLNAVLAVSERFETDAVVGPRRLVVVHERGRCVSRSQEPAGARRGARLDVRLDRTILNRGFDCAWARLRLDEWLTSCPASG